MENYCKENIEKNISTSVKAVCDSLGILSYEIYLEHLKDFKDYNGNLMYVEYYLHIETANDFFLTIKPYNFVSQIDIVYNDNLDNQDPLTFRLEDRHSDYLKIFLTSYNKSQN